MGVVRQENVLLPATGCIELLPALLVARTITELFHQVVKATSRLARGMTSTSVPSAASFLM